METNNKYVTAEGMGSVHDFLDKSITEKKIFFGGGLQDSVKLSNGIKVAFLQNTHTLLNIDLKKIRHIAHS